MGLPRTKQSTYGTGPLLVSRAVMRCSNAWIRSSGNWSRWYAVSFNTSASVIAMFVSLFFVIAVAA